MINNLEQAPNILQVIIKVPSYNQDGRRYYTNMNVSKDKISKIIELIEGKKESPKNDTKNGQDNKKKVTKKVKENKPEGKTE